MAKAIKTLAATSDDKREEGSVFNIDKAVMAGFEPKTLGQILESPVCTLQVRARIVARDNSPQCALPARFQASVHQHSYQLAPSRLAYSAPLPPHRLMSQKRCQLANVSSQCEAPAADGEHVHARCRG